VFITNAFKNTQDEALTGRLHLLPFFTWGDTPGQIKIGFQLKTALKVQVISARWQRLGNKKKQTIAAP